MRIAVIRDGVRRHHDQCVRFADDQGTASAGAGKGEVAGEARCGAGWISSSVI